METVLTTIILGGIGFIVCGLVLVALMGLWFRKAALYSGPASALPAM